jgi:4-carboxymuconolactone decarboxylase
MNRPEFDTELFQAGLKVRREVLGNAHVDRALAAVDDFNVPMQKLVTEWCWGELWNRVELSRRERSLINLGMLAALNRSPEIKLHVRGALNNGLDPASIREVFMQVAIYCGVPAALESMRIASEVLKEEGVKA